MAYDNPVFDMIERNPIVSFFTVPILIGWGSSWVAGLVRKGKTGSYFRGVFDDNSNDLSPMAGLGSSVRTEGGSIDDLTFRATANTAPIKRGTTVGDEIQALPIGPAVRYDRDYHESIFFPNLDYKDNKQVVSQSYPAKVTDTYVFAGISGINKIGMR